MSRRYSSEVKKMGDDENYVNTIAEMSGRFAKFPPTTIITGATKFAYMPLTSSEAEVFYRDIRRIASIQSFERDLSSLLLNDLPTYVYAAGVAKGSIGTNPVFGGLTASNTEVGMQLIRAITVRNVGISSGSPNLTWSQTYSSDGWTNMFGSATAPVNLSQMGLGSGATDTQNRVMLAFSGLINTTVPPLVAEYRFHVQNVDYQVEPITWEPISDLAYVRLAAPVIIQTNGTFYMRGNIQPAGTDATQLLGLTFATGDYLTYET